MLAGSGDMDAFMREQGFSHGIVGDDASVDGAAAWVEAIIYRYQ